MHATLARGDARRLFWLCWVSYFCSYLGRQNYASVMSALIGDVLTKQQAGWIGTGFYISYAVGQLANGLLMERRSPYVFCAVGLLGSGLLNALFPSAHSFAALFLLRLLTGYCMSMLWPSLFQAIVRNMRHEDVVRATVDIASAMAGGTLGSYLLCAGLLRWSGWRAAFHVPGLALLLAGAAWLAGYPRVVRRAVVPAQAPDAPAAEAAPEAPMPIGQLVLMPALLCALLPVILDGAIKDGVASWIPTYISEVFGQTPSFAALVSALLPVANLSGAYMARWLYRRTGERVFSSAAWFFGASTLLFAACLTLLSRLIVPTLIAFALITSFMMAINVLFINLLPLRFERFGRTATVTGGVNAIAYGGSAAASALIGILSHDHGWGAAMLSWTLMTGVGGLVCVLSRRWNR